MDRKPITERKIWKNIDPVVIERTNLVAISQLVIKHLLDSSLRHARQLDVERSLPLQQLFVLLDLIFRHGFKTGRRLISGGKDIWSLLQQVDRLDPSAVDISESVRELPHVKTNMGRARAWFRLALMQKKLPEYFKALIEHKETLLREYYHPEALLLSEEAVLFSGLLVSLNIVDFNLCVKDEELDFQNNVIDLSMYLRRKEDIGRTDSQALFPTLQSMQFMMNHCVSISVADFVSPFCIRNKFQCLFSSDGIFSDHVSIRVLW